MKTLGRPLKPGISFYRMNSGHIRNKKVRLLFNEFDSDGYYIWSCILDYAYETWGYYFDTNDKEELELFASDFCKKKLTTINEVITGCIRRDLFDKDVFDSFGILTCDMMQETFIIATGERRQKGSVFHIQAEWLKIDLSAEIPQNIVIVPPKNSIVPPKNPIIPPKNSQSREKNRRNKKKEDNKPNGVAPAQPAPAKKLGKKSNEEPEPYWQELIKVWFDFHKANKLDEPSFSGKDPRIFQQLVGLLKKRASKKNQEWTSPNACGSLNYFLTLASKEKWLSEHFLLENLTKQFDAVYQRSLLDKQKKNNQNQASSSPEAKSFNDTLMYLFGRYQEGQLNEALILPEYYDKLVVRDVIAVGTLDHMAGDTIDEKKRNAIIELFKQKIIAVQKQEEIS